MFKKAEECASRAMKRTYPKSKRADSKKRRNSTMWIGELRFDPILSLISSNDEAIEYFARRDLLEERVPPIQHVWTLPEVQKNLRKQQPNGSWPARKTNDPLRSRHYSLFETWKTFRTLVEQYELNRSNEETRKVAECILSFQSSQGDIRGIAGNQYATYYTGVILADLTKAGYARDPRIEKGLQWLLSMRQNDGGWTIPMLTHKFDRKTTYKLTTEQTDPVEPDKSKPFSHNWTDMVLRAFAVNPSYQQNAEIRKAAELLKSSFFKPDNYSSMQAATYWVRFLFWWPNLLTALDSLSRLGFTRNDKDIEKGVQWLITHQQRNGLWKTSYVKGQKGTRNKRSSMRELWLTLNICRTIKRFDSLSVS